MNLAETVARYVEQLGEDSLTRLGFVLAEITENRGEHLERAQQDLKDSELLLGLEEERIAKVICVAVGADAARIASDSGALADGIMELESRDFNRLADFAAESIDFTALQSRYYSAASRVLDSRGTWAPFANRHAAVATASYMLFVRPRLETELAELGQ